MVGVVTEGTMAHELDMFSVIGIDARRVRGLAVRDNLGKTFTAADISHSRYDRFSCE
jgi:hypothetical protein